MNPLTIVKRIQSITAKEADLGISDEASWHAKYRDSAYVFAGGFPYDLTEGDLLAVFSQYGEIVDVNLVRDKATGKSKGFAFIAYEDQRSTVLAVDNLNGAQIGGRTIRVDHVANYKKKEEEDEETERQKREERGVCRAFQKGECKYGDSCKFSHDEQRAANTGWGAEEEKSKWANDKFDNRAGLNKRSHDAPPSRDAEPKWQRDQDVGDTAKRSEYKEDQDKRNVEIRTSRYETESKRHRDDSGGRAEMKSRGRDIESSGRDILNEDRGRARGKDRSRDRSSDRWVGDGVKDRSRDWDRRAGDAVKDRSRDWDREKQSSKTRDYSSQHRRDREGRCDEDYHKSRR